MTLKVLEQAVDRFIAADGPGIDDLSVYVTISRIFFNFQSLYVGRGRSHAHSGHQSTVPLARAAGLVSSGSR